MSKDEQKLLDSNGKFVQIIQDGEELKDKGWTNGRILLSNKRIILATGDGKRQIPIGKISSVEGRHDANRAIAQVDRYVSVRFDDDVYLISTRETEVFEHTLHKTILNGDIILIKHPAIEGGVVQDTEWQKARIKLDEGVINFAVKDGSFIQVEIDDVGSIEQKVKTVKSKERGVIEASHTEDDGTAVETYISGSKKQCSVINSVLNKGAEKHSSSIDIGPEEQEVLMALYSGVSPFEVPGFLDMEADTVEEIYDELIDLDVLEEVRVRREVALKPRGRNIASESMNDQ